MEVEGDRTSKMGFTFGVGLGVGSELPAAKGISRHLVGLRGFHLCWPGYPSGLERQTGLGPGDS